MTDGSRISDEFAGRLARLPWITFHTRIVLAVGAVWALAGLAANAVAAVGLAPVRDPAWMGGAAAAYLLGEAAGVLGGGALARRYGRRRMLWAAVFVFIAANAAPAVLPGVVASGSVVPGAGLPGAGLPGSVVPGAGVSGALLPGVVAYVAVRFAAGVAGGAEYAAVLDAVEELMPRGRRTPVLLAVNGLYWFGGLLGAAAQFALAQPGAVPGMAGWRAGLLVAPVLGLLLAGACGLVPESPSWLVRAGRTRQAAAIVDTAERDARAAGHTLGRPPALPSAPAAALPPTPGAPAGAGAPGTAAGTLPPGTGASGQAGTLSPGAVTGVPVGADALAPGVAAGTLPPGTGLSAVAGTLSPGVLGGAGTPPPGAVTGVPVGADALAPGVAAGTLPPGTGASGPAGTPPPGTVAGVPVGAGAPRVVREGAFAVLRAMVRADRGVTVRAVVLCASQGGAYGAVLFTLVAVVSGVYHVGGAAAPAFAVVFAVANLVGAVVLGRLLAPGGQGVPFAVAHMWVGGPLALAGALLGRGLGSAWLTTLLLCLAFLIAAPSTVMLVADAAAHYPEPLRRPAMRVLSAVARLGGVPGPLVFGVLLAEGSRGAVSLGYVAAALSVVVAGLIAVALRTPAAHEQPASPFDAAPRPAPYVRPRGPDAPAWSFPRPPSLAPRDDADR